MKEFSEKTLIPLSLVMSILGGAGWLTYIYFQGEANAASVEEIHNDLYTMKREDENFKREVIDRLARIEEKISKFKKGDN